MNTSNIFQKIEAGLISKGKNLPFVLAIDGRSASGKTTLGHQIQEQFPQSNLFHLDDYFLQPYQRTKERLREVGGNVDYERFREEIVVHLKDRTGVSYHVYNCRTQKLGLEIQVPWQPFVIIEGAYSQHPYFGNIYDLRIFLEISKEEQRERILKRDGKRKLERFLSEWIPKENEYFEAYNIKKQSLIVIP